MKKINNYKELASDISSWIKEYAINAGLPNLVIGCSGGIDSSVVSTLCAMTGLPTYCVSIDIKSNPEHLSIAEHHVYSLNCKYHNIIWKVNNLSSILDMFIDKMDYNSDHAIANTKSRLRMTTLHHIASVSKGIVVGTGNKIEDFGVGFYTKYGDGGVDISPIADLTKTEVYELAKELGILEEIIQSSPTDGLWEDSDKTDENQLGATYPELEWAMEFVEKNAFHFEGSETPSITKRQKEVLDIYIKFNNQNKHKMVPIPVFNTLKYRS